MGKVNSIIMKKIRIYLFSLACLMMVSSCAVYNDRFDNNMLLWKDKPEDDVYLVYGPPMRSQTLKDGKKLVSYDYEYQSGQENDFCIVTFTIENEVVLNAKYEGDYSAIRKYVKAPEGVTGF